MIFAGFDVCYSLSLSLYKLKFCILFFAVLLINFVSAYHRHIILQHSGMCRINEVILRKTIINARSSLLILTILTKLSSLVILSSLIVIVIC